MLLNQAIIYEEPANQLIRACLRIEALFNQLKQTLNKPNTWCSHLSIISLLDLIKILEKSQLKTNLAKELQRQLARLQPLLKSPDVDLTRLQSIIDQLDMGITALRSINGKLAAKLRENPFLQNVNNHTPYPASYFSFDSPQYYQWLHQPLAQRITDLKSWLTDLQPSYQAVAILLQLIRDNNRPQMITIDDGLYQTSLDKTINCQLVRVRLPEEVDVFPKISLSKHRLSIQFYQTALNSRPALSSDTITFELTSCMT